MDPRRQEAVIEAQRWIGTPFRMNAAIRGVGVDCGRFLVEVYRTVGVEVGEELPLLSRQWHLHTQDNTYIEIIQRHCTPVPEPIPGGIAMFRLSRHSNRPYSHSALVVSWPRVIHVHWSSGVEWADATKAPLDRLPVLFFDPFR